MAREIREHSQLTEEELILHISRCDSEALTALYDRHAQTVYNLIMRIVREPASGDEILQDTFWQVWQKANTFQHGNATAWLYRIARNKSLDWLRRQKARPQPTMSLDEPKSMAVAMTTATHVEHAVAQNWQQEQIQRALANLPLEQRQCLELAFFEGLSQRQIAEHTQTPVSTVKTRIQMALDKLERALRAAGYRSGEGAR